MEEEQVNDIRLLLNMKAYVQMRTYCLAAPGEMSAFGMTYTVKSNYGPFDILVKEIKLIEQVNNSVHTQLTDDGIAEFLYNLAIRGADPTRWNFWFHTHPGTACGWSGEDNENIAKYSKSVMFVSMNMDRFGNMCARVDYQGKTKELTIVILPTGHNRFVARCKKEILRKGLVAQNSYPDISMKNLFSNITGQNKE